MQGREDNKKKKTCVVVVDLNWKLFFGDEEWRRPSIDLRCLVPPPLFACHGCRKREKKSRDDILLLPGLVWSGWWVDLTEYIPSCGKEGRSSLLPNFLVCVISRIVCLCRRSIFLSLLWDGKKERKKEEREP